MITLTENAKNYLNDIKKDDYITLGVMEEVVLDFSTCGIIRKTGLM